MDKVSYSVEYKVTGWTNLYKQNKTSTLNISWVNTISFMADRKVKISFAIDESKNRKCWCFILVMLNLFEMKTNNV